MTDPGRMVCTAGPWDFVLATMIPSLPGGVMTSRRTRFLKDASGDDGPRAVGEGRLTSTSPDEQGETKPWNDDDDEGEAVDRVLAGEWFFGVLGLLPPSPPSRSGSDSTESRSSSSSFRSLRFFFLDRPAATRTHKSSTAPPAAMPPITAGVNMPSAGVPSSTPAPSGCSTTDRTPLTADRDWNA